MNTTINIFMDMDKILLVENSMITGPGIESAKKKLLTLYHIDDVRERNEVGLTKVDKETVRRLLELGELGPGETKIEIARQIIGILNHYKNTQARMVLNVETGKFIPFDELVNLIKGEASTLSQQGQQTNIIVFTKTPLYYGKVKVHIPNLEDRKNKIEVNKILNNFFENPPKSINNGQPFQQRIDNYDKMSYSWIRYKFFQKDMKSIDCYLIHTLLLPMIINYVKSVSPNILILDEDGKPFDLAKLQQPQQQSALPSSEPALSKPKIKIIDKRNVYNAERTVITFENTPFEVSKKILDEAKEQGLVPKFYSYGGKEVVSGKSVAVFLIKISYPAGSADAFIDHWNSVTKVIKIMSDNGVDISELEFELKARSQEPASKVEDTSDEMKFQHLQPYNNMARMRIQIITETDKIWFLKELINFTFPENQKIQEPNKPLNFSNTFEVSGEYRQYVSFGQILRNQKMNCVATYRAFLREKIQKGEFKETTWEGNVPADFEEKIDQQMPNMKYELYDAQKEGVAFLFGRRSAILGDETGLGKTVQLITAAELKMKQEDYKFNTLVVTLKATQKQWVEEILNTVGEQDKDKISTNGLDIKRWTVLYYENFSAGKNLQELLDNLKSKGNFGIVILDEIHKTKHADSKRSMNIAEILNKAGPNGGSIIYRWGASATISSNKPMNVQNQLSTIGHPLGLISEKMFKRKFGGYVFDKEKRRYVEGQFSDKAQAAEKLNKWLHLSGVYVRRAKADIRQMPSLKKSSHITQIDEKQFQDGISQRLQTYKDEELAISILLAARQSAAVLKTTETAQKVLEIVKNNSKNPNPAASKIVVFTNFQEAANLLKDKISSGLKQINPSYRLITFLSNTPKKEREKVKETFTNDPNVKVLLMSMKMGGTGIDFPNAAQNMIINDFDWTPESAEQSEGRIYRINTNHPVDITYVVADNFDASQFERLETKRKLADLVQQWRREYMVATTQEKEREALREIIKLKKEMLKVDKQSSEELGKLIAKHGHGGAAQEEEFQTESFKGFINLYDKAMNLFSS